mmetsp:Transcript_3887/g.17918  ORF Transcript_3887/g.17918 Transcript_3887/m.17918 type:complete len:218 (+) Transcript_3887:360-1013(+)
MAPRSREQPRLPPVPQPRVRPRFQRFNAVAGDAMDPPRSHLGELGFKRSRRLQRPREAGGRAGRRTARDASRANASDEGRGNAAVSLRDPLLRARVRALLAHTRGSRAPPTAAERAIRRARPAVPLHRRVVGERADELGGREGADPRVFHVPARLSCQRQGPTAGIQDAGRRRARGRDTPDVGERITHGIPPNASRGAGIRARFVEDSSLDRSRVWA